MIEDDQTFEAIIWADDTKARHVERVLQLTGNAIEVIGVGGPRSSEVSDLAKKVGCKVEDDLRKLLVDRPARFVLLTTMEEVNRIDLSNAIGAGSVVLSLEPAVVDFDWSDAGVHFVPGFMNSGGWLKAADPLEAIGQVCSISYKSLGLSGEGSLFARLYDAWQVILSAGQLPLSIDASLVGPLAGPPENLVGLTGHLTAHARVCDECSAVLQVSDLSGGMGRSLEVIGQTGHLHVDDEGYALRDAGGEVLDGSQPGRVGRTYAELIVDHFREVMKSSDRDVSSNEVVDQAAVLACCQACLLSARTGEAESPGKLLEMQGR